MTTPVDLQLPYLTAEQYNNLPLWLAQSPQPTLSVTTDSEGGPVQQMNIDPMDEQNLSINEPCPSPSVQIISKPEFMNHKNNKKKFNHTQQQRQFNQQPMVSNKRPNTQNDINDDNKHNDTMYLHTQNIENYTPSTSWNTNTNNANPAIQNDYNYGHTVPENVNVSQLTMAPDPAYKDFEGLFRMLYTLNQRLTGSYKISHDMFQKYQYMIAQFNNQRMIPNHMRLIPLLLAVYDLFTTQEIDPFITRQLLHQIFVKYATLRSIQR